MFIQSISFSSILIVSMFSRHVLHLLMINIDQYWSYMVLFNSISSSIKSHLVFSCYEIFIVIEYYKNFYVKNTSGIQYSPSITRSFITRSPCITQFFLKIFFHPEHVWFPNFITKLDRFSSIRKLSAIENRISFFCAKRTYWFAQEDTTQLYSSQEYFPRSWFPSFDLIYRTPFMRRFFTQNFSSQKPRCRGVLLYTETPLLSRKSFTC